jgi:hypothetical protein
MNKHLEEKTIQSRIRLIKALNMAIAETDKLNNILDSMHEMLVANETKQAA